MNQFIFILKDTTQKAFNSFFWFLFFLHLIIISIIIINSADNYHRYVAWSAVLLIAFFLIIFYFFKDKFKLIFFQAALFVLIIAFWSAQMAWLPAAIVMLMISFAAFVLRKKSMAIFSRENIIIVKTLFRKAYSWAEIENVVLKDRLLSVDFKNNHLIQIEISPESYGIDEATFNQFCDHQLTP